MNKRYDWNRRRTKRATAKQKRQPGSDAEWAMVRQTRWIIGLSVMTAILAIGATSFTGLQWWEAHTGAETAEMQANASVTLANTARVQADTAREQVKISKAQVEVLGQSASAASESAITATNSLL